MYTFDDSYRLDDWSNPAAGLGSIRDKSVGLTFRRRRRLDRRTLEAIYEQNAIAARIVDKIVDDALRHGWSVTNVVGGIDHDVLEKRMLKLRVKQGLAKWAKWGRLYGGALLTLPTLGRDNNTPSVDKPMQVADVGSLFSPSVIAAHNARPIDTDAAFFSPTFGQTLSYEITGLVARPVTVHHSRVVKHEPVELAIDALANESELWGPSVVERIFDDLGRDGAARSHAVAMMYIASILYLKITGYRETYKTREGKEQLREMMAAARRDLDSLGLLGIDGADELGSINLTTTGTYELIDRMRNALAASADMPKEILFNETPSGLNAGELSGPQELWFARVEAFQEEVLGPALNAILEVEFAAQGWNVESWEIEWAPLWTKSEKETAEVAKLNAETDQIYVTMGAATPEEYREHRFVKNEVGPLDLSEAAEEPVLDLTGEVVAYQQLVEPLDLSGGVATMPPAFDLSQVAPLDLSGGAVAVATDDAAPSAEPPPSDLVSPRDAAAMFGVATRTITRQIQLGALRYWGIGAHKRISSADVAKLALSHERPNEEPLVVAAA